MLSGNEKDSKGVFAKSLKKILLALEQQQTTTLLTQQIFKLSSNDASGKPTTARRFVGVMFYR